MGVAHFQIVTEHIVESYLERRYARAFDLSLLHLEKIVLSMSRYLAEFIQFLIHSARNDIALSKLRRSLGMHGPSQIIQQLGAVSHPVDEHIHRLYSSSLAEFHDRADLAKSPSQLHHFARHDLAGCST